MPQWPIHANVGGGEATEAGPVGGSVAEAVLATVTGAGPAGGRGLEAGSVGVAEEKLDRAKQYEGGRGVLSLQQQLYQEEQARVTRGAETSWFTDLETFRPVKCSSPKRSASKGISVFRKTPGACRPKSAFSCLPATSNSPVLNLFDLPDRFRYGAGGGVGGKVGGGVGGAGGAEGRVIGVGGGGGNSYAAATGLMEEQLQTYCVNPVEVKVSNLDYNISGGEWKKILYSEFNQHILILDIYIETQPDNTSIAFVVVPSIDQARFAISQFHRKKIGYKYIRVELVHPDADHQPADSERTSEVILMERRPGGASGNPAFLPQPSLRCSTLNANASEWLPPVSEVRTCALHCATGTAQYLTAMTTVALPNVTISLRVFAPQVHTLLQGHNGSLPLISFPDCYNIEFSALPTTFDSGVPVEHLINCIQGIKIVVCRGGVKKVQWCKNERGANKSNDGAPRSSNPLLQQQMSQFEREVMDVLKHALHTRMPLDQFQHAYHAHFGRQCRVADYGYTKLLELLEAAPVVTEIIGEASHKVVTLSHRVQMKRFTFDVLRMLKSQASKQINLADFAHIYSRILARPFDIVDYGVCFIEDALNELEEAILIMVTGSGEDTVISIPKREQTAEEERRTQQFAAAVVDLLKQTDHCCISFHKFIPAYHHHFGRQCRVGDYGFTKLIELLEAIPTVLKIVDGPNEKWLYLTEREMLKAVGEQIFTLLQTCPGHALPVDQFPAVFLRHYGHALQLSDYAVSSLAELADILPASVNVTVELQQDQQVIVIDVSGSGGQAASASGAAGSSVAPPGGSRVTVALRVLWLLMERCDSGGMPASRLLPLYALQFNDLLDMQFVRSNLDDVVQVNECGSGVRVRLLVAQMFAREVRTLLMCACDGALPMARVADVFSTHFGVTLVPAAYGFPDLGALLTAASSHVLRLYAHPTTGPMVALSYRFKSFLSSIGSPDLEQPVTPESLRPGAETGTLLSDSGIGEPRDADDRLFSVAAQSNAASPRLDKRTSTNNFTKSPLKNANLTGDDSTTQTSALQMAARLLPVVPRAKCSPARRLITMESRRNEHKD